MNGDFSQDGSIGYIAEGIRAVYLYLNTGGHVPEIFPLRLHSTTPISLSKSPILYRPYDVSYPLSAVRQARKVVMEGVLMVSKSAALDKVKRALNARDLDASLCLMSAKNAPISNLIVTGIEEITTVERYDGIEVRITAEERLNG